MKKSWWYILVISVIAITGVFLLQFIWLHNYYQVNRDRFEKEVNLAFEDAIKLELMERCDTIEALLYQFLLDTNNVKISSKWSDKNNRYVYSIANRKDTTDRYSFSHNRLVSPIVSYGDTTYRKVAKLAARNYREEDLERHILFYRTQNIGNYLSAVSTGTFAFDTSRLRTIYTRVLTARDIHEPFQFLLRGDDNTLNHNTFPDSLEHRFPVITKSFPTYKNLAGKNYVRAMFGAPGAYLLGKMTGVAIGSLLLLFIVGLALFTLLQVIRREKKLSAIKNDFIANITHDLKTPIATVSGAVEAMDSFGVLDDPAKTKRYLHLARNELDRLNDMVSQILDLAIYEQQDVPFKKEPVDVQALFESATTSHRVEAGKAIRFFCDAQPASPPLNGDRLYLQHAINNLVDNAIKYSGKDVLIRLKHGIRDQWHTILVEDNGMGIPKSEQPYIFDKFFRVKQNGQAVKGYGLGLSYVQSIVKLHGGYVELHSQPGAGSSFTINLPV